jgi:hypothetical protein
MKRLLFFFFCCLAISNTELRAAAEDKKPLPPAKSEKELVQRIINTLKEEDSTTHSGSFMKFDDLWKMVVNYRDTSVSRQMQVNQLRQVPNAVRKFDPFFNPQIGLDFNHIIEKGTDSGIHWDRVVLARYELKKMEVTSDLIGYNFISPLRFKGYIYITDEFSRKTFGMAVTDIQNIKGNWYGGHVVDIYEAGDEDAYLKKLKIEEAWLKSLIAQGIDIDSMKRSIDSIRNADNEHGADSGDVNTRREVAERKYYFGLLDDEIPVTLYVQYLRGGCPEKVCEWIGILKFDDEGDYFKVEVHKENGKWYFTQADNKSVLELELKGKTYSGSWLSVKDQIEYEAYFEEVTAKPSTVDKLDALVDELWYDNEY